MADGRVFLGIPDAREELAPATWPALKNLLRNLETYHHPLASDRRHSLYRAQAERWLESLVCEDVTRIDVALTSRLALSAAEVLRESSGIC